MTNKDVIAILVARGYSQPYEPERCLKYLGRLDEYGYSDDLIIALVDPEHKVLNISLNLNSQWGFLIKAPQLHYFGREEPYNPECPTLTESMTTAIEQEETKLLKAYAVLTKGTIL